MSPKARDTKAKMNYWDFIKIKSAQQRKQLTKPKDNHRMGEDTTNILSDKGLLAPTIQDI